MTRPLTTLASALALLLLGACGDGERSTTTSTVDAPTPHLLPADVPGAVAVLEAKKKEPGEVVAVVGRVRSTAKGVITLVDTSLDYCGSGKDTMEECETPWDYCCIDQTVVANATIIVQAKAKDGSTVAKKDLGVRPLDLVAVKGELVKNEHGAVVLLADDGWYRRERPVVPAHVRFPD